MKICQINCVYGEGSTGKLTRGIHLSLIRKGISSIVAFPFGKDIYPEQGLFPFSSKKESLISAFYRRFTGRQFDGAVRQTKRLLRILQAERPDIVHIQCINGNSINIYKLLKYLAQNGIPTIYTIHAEFPYTGGCGHAYECDKWKTGCGNCPILKEGTQSYFIDGTARTWKQLNKAYSLFKPQKLLFTTVSPWLQSRASAAPLLENFNIKTILNGVDTTIFRYKESNIRASYGIKEGAKMILHVTASFDPQTEGIKGGQYILRLAEKFPNYFFVVAANYGSGFNLPNNILFIGRTKTQEELSYLYSSADLTVLTSRRETFSMVTAESLCCGTRVVGFEAGGPESITIPSFSKFVAYGDIDRLCDAIVEQIQITSSDDKHIISKEAQEKYANENMVNQFLDVYKMMEKYRNQ